MSFRNFIKRAKAQAINLQPPASSKIFSKAKPILEGYFIVGLLFIIGSVHASAQGLLPRPFPPKCDSSIAIGINSGFCLKHQSPGSTSFACKSSSLELDWTMATDDNTTSMVVLGLIGGVVGAMAGGSLGAAITDESNDYFLEEAVHIILGAMAGESFGLAYGVHLGNGSQGDVFGSALISGLICIGGMVLAAGVESPVALIAIPIGQLITCMGIERDSG